MTDLRISDTDRLWILSRVTDSMVRIAIGNALDSLNALVDKVEALEGETRSANSAEQELRETAGELEKTRGELTSARAKYGCYKHSAMQTVGALRLKLTEATALLDVFVDGARNALQFMRDDMPSAAEEMLKAILSRAPAQPAAPTPDPHGVTLYAGRGQPAAPTPEHPECTTCHRPAACLGSYENNTSWGYSCDECCGHGNEDGRCFPLADIPDHYLALVKRLAQLEDEQPAAPEPDHVNGCAWFVGGPCTRDCGTPEHEPAAPEPSGESVAKERYLLQCEVAESLRVKLLAAEAQLATVRRWVDGCPDNRPVWQHCQALKAIRSLLTAPSPGTFECDAHHAFECKMCTGAGEKRSTRDVVETAIDLSKSDKRRTWQKAVRDTAELPVSVMASSKSPAAPEPSADWKRGYDEGALDVLAAEAQLAAVRAVVDRVVNGVRSEQAELQACGFRMIRDMLTAPTGEGSNT